MIEHRLRNPLLTALLICAFLCQGTWALAGTTGSLSGMLVESTNGSPIANATIAVTSPSQQTSTTTDASGHFSFISLAPDTYTVSATKDGYQPQSLAGVTIFADNAQVIALKTTKALKNIAIVSARAAGALVKPGTTSDIYSVNAATQETVQSIGGGGNLNSAYSAIVSVPGVQSAIGNEGAGQTIYIRGSQFNEIGYEYDGVPVNRAFDNYNATSLSNLGQQELQVYTGGSPAGASSATVGGFINQVIKTGTYPGFGTIITGIGGPTFYHNLQLEAGGASPNRLFSWYAGLGGYNQEFRFGDNKDFGDVPTDGSSRYGFTGTQGIGNIGLFSNFYTNGPWATCVNGVAPAGALLLENSGATPATKIPGCFNYSSNAYNTLGNIADREGVINLHFGLPHKKDGGRDDVQLLYSGSAYHTQYNDSINDLGGMQVFNNVWTPLNGGVNAGAYCNFSATIGAPILGYPACATSGNSQVAYVDGAIFPTGTTFGQSASTATAIPYLFPNSPTNRTPFTSGIDPRARGAIWNDSQTVKVQYQKNIGSNAYLRVFGYTFYSDWLQNSPTEGALLYTDTLAGGPFSGAVAPDYELSTHTRGVELQFADQLNAKNLLKFTTNYTTASVVRFYNQSWRRGMGASATNLADADGNCYDYTLGHSPRACRDRPPARTVIQFLERRRLAAPQFSPVRNSSSRFQVEPAPSIPFARSSLRPRSKMNSNRAIGSTSTWVFAMRSFSTARPTATRRSITSGLALRPTPTATTLAPASRFSHHLPQDSRPEPMDRCSSPEAVSNA